MKKTNIFKIFIFILSVFLVIQFSIINLTNKKEIKEKEIKKIADKKVNNSKKNDIIELLSLGNNFQILKIEKDSNEFWKAYLNISGDLKSNLDKIDVLIKNNIKIISYNADFKEGIGSINLEVQVGG